MPQGKGTYGNIKGRPPKKKSIRVKKGAGKKITIKAKRKKYPNKMYPNKK